VGAFRKLHLCRSFLPPKSVCAVFSQTILKYDSLLFFLLNADRNVWLSAYDQQQTCSSFTSQTLYFHP
jgi:hypothetical protein